MFVMYLSIMEYELRWESDKTKVTSKTFDSLDKARKFACGKIAATVYCGGSLTISVYEASPEQRHIGDVYGDGSYVEDLGDGFMWVEDGQGYESNLVPGISTSTGKINKKLYRLT